MATKPSGRVIAQRLWQLEHGTSSDDLLEQILSPDNLQRAWLRVKANGGAAGVDGMPIAQFPAFARQHWEKMRLRLLAGTYHPAPVRRVFIPKPNGDLRPLGIPTMLSSGGFPNCLWKAAVGGENPVKQVFSD